MKKFFTYLLLSGFAFCLILGSSFAQQGPQWPEDPAKKQQAMEQRNAYMQAVKAKDFPAAAEAIEWLLMNTPELHPSIYEHGVKIYLSLCGQAENEETLALHQYRVLDLYDAQSYYFGQAEVVLEQKVYYAMKFFHQDANWYPELASMFQEVFEARGKAVNEQLVYPYMLLAVSYFQAYPNDFPDTQLQAVEEKLLAVLTAKAKDTPAKAKKYQSLSQRIQGMGAKVLSQPQ